jgi:hypothetical protein
MMIPCLEAETIDWNRLLQEFAVFEPDAETARVASSAFARSLRRPVPAFVATFLELKLKADVSQADALRSLYAFLLEKRYAERLNLLYFAFTLFDENDSLPEAIVARTPFPHEDGIPKFRHLLERDQARDR